MWKTDMEHIMNISERFPVIGILHRLLYLKIRSMKMKLWLDNMRPYSLTLTREVEMVLGLACLKAKCWHLKQVLSRFGKTHKRAEPWVRQSNRYIRVIVLK